MDRAEKSMATFEEAKLLASSNGFILKNPSMGCYQLKHLSKGWIMNLYPRMSGFSPRIYNDPHHRGPFLKLPEGWTLLDVVKAAIVFEEKLRKT